MGEATPSGNALDGHLFDEEPFKRDSSLAPVDCPRGLFYHYYSLKRGGVFPEGAYMRKKECAFVVAIFIAVAFGGCAPRVAKKEVEAARPAPVEEEKPLPVEKEPPSPPAEAKKPFFLSDVFFDYDRHFIREDAKKILKENADALRGNPVAKVLLEGHACKIGTNEYNLALAERRAQAVKNYLTTLGVEPERIATVSYGEEKPFCTVSDDEACLSQNRRVHFVKVE
jgi:peptidoglycan-associated lipoprotein